MFDEKLNVRMVISYLVGRLLADAEWWDGTGWGLGRSMQRIMDGVGERG
jgi:hypothetical protein